MFQTATEPTRTSLCGKPSSLHPSHLLKTAGQHPRPCLRTTRDPASLTQPTKEDSCRRNPALSCFWLMLTRQSWTRPSLFARTPALRA